MYIHTKGFEVIVTNDYKSNNNKTKTKKKFKISTKIVKYPLFLSIHRHNFRPHRLFSLVVLDFHPFLVRPHPHPPLVHPHLYS